MACLVRPVNHLEIPKENLIVRDFKNNMKST